MSRLVPFRFVSARLRLRFVSLFRLFQLLTLALPFPLPFPCCFLTLRDVSLRYVTLPLASLRFFLSCFLNAKGQERHG